ncbi:MAG: hypothetical protein ISP54_01850, partial [Flavobacteriales bacterium]|nr:hypothetical protein [Flavobacteriales bacterium]
MKNTVFLSAIACSLCALAFLQNQPSEVALYAPRQAEAVEPVQDASGMEQLLLALRGDIETGEMNHE